MTLVAGHPTRVRTLGTGARPVLALHCSLAHGGAWSALGALLGDAAKLTAPDLPSHGQSGDLPAGADLHDLSTVIATELAGQIGDGVPVDVIGHSFGGTVALRLGLERPDLVRSLTLFEPVFFAAARGTAAYDDWLASQAGFGAHIAAGQFKEAARWFNALWGQGTALDALSPAQRSYLVDRIHLIPAANEVLFDDRAALLAPGRLEALDVPVLLAEGALSPPIIDATMAGLARRLPRAERLVLDGAAHMLPISHAAVLAGRLRAHLGLDA